MVECTTGGIGGHERGGLAGRVRTAADVPALPRHGRAGGAAVEHSGVPVTDRQLHTPAATVEAAVEARVGPGGGGLPGDAHADPAEATLAAGNPAADGGGADVRPAAEPGAPAAVAEPGAVRGGLARRPHRAAGCARQRRPVGGDVEAGAAVGVVARLDGPRRGDRAPGPDAAVVVGLLPRVAQGLVRHARGRHGGEPLLGPVAHARAPALQAGLLRLRAVPGQAYRAREGPVGPR
eukprot:254068-Hanusia_phi.AAC.3